MSAKSRGADSIVGDWYRTPDKTTRAAIQELLPDLLKSFNGRKPRFLEPTAGTGGMVRVLREFFPESHITAVELDRERFDLLKATGAADVVACTDYIDFPPPTQPYDLCLQNPPFLPARNILEKATLESTQTLALLRLGFLSSADRRPFWRRHPADILPLSDRPSFAASLKCVGVKVRKVRGGPKPPKAKGCGWALIQDLDAPRVKLCPRCTVGAVDVNTADSADYMFAHFHPEARPVRIL